MRKEGKEAFSEELRWTRVTTAKDWRESNMALGEISALWTLSKFDLVLNSIGSPHKLLIFHSLLLSI